MRASRVETGDCVAVAGSLVELPEVPEVGSIPGRNAGAGAYLSTHHACAESSVSRPLGSSATVTTMAHKSI